MIYLDSMGHCYSDTSLEELYDFCVVKLGLKPEWNHYSNGFPHFDIRYDDYRQKVLNLGAKAITNREMVRLVRGETSPFKDLHLKGEVPIYRDKFYGKPLLRIDFAKYFAAKSS